MLKITDLVISNDSIGKKALLVEVKPRYKYANGQRTEEIEGYAYTIVLPEKQFKKLIVKIDGDKKMDTPAEGYTEVIFEGLELSIYWVQGQYAVAAKATGIRPVNSKN